MKTLHFEKDAKAEKKKAIQVKPISPLGDIIAPSASLNDGIANHQTASRVLMGLAKLASAKFDENGSIQSEWTKTSDNLEFVTTILWGETTGFMPSDVKHYFIRGNQRELVSHVKCEYKKVGTRWLPSRYVGVHFSLGGDNEQHMDLAFQWRCRESLEQFSIDPSLPDWRTPVEELFEDTDWKKFGTWSSN